MSVIIHGNKYVTVAERVAEYHADTENKTLSITTEVIPHPVSVVVKATVVTHKGTFTGMSAANPTKTIEKMSPYEVAETSAVGRALGFAGYGAVDSIATADEMVKAGAMDTTDSFVESLGESVDLGVCGKCGSPNTKYKSGKIGCSNYCWMKK